MKEGLLSQYIGSTLLAATRLDMVKTTRPHMMDQAIRNSLGYTTPPVYNNLTGAYYTDIISNPTITPSANSVFEVGTDVRFLSNRIGLDVTYFNAKIGPRIFQLASCPQTTGYTSAIQNGITTRKTGMEVTLEWLLL